MNSTEPLQVQKYAAFSSQSYSSIKLWTVKLEQALSEGLPHEELILNIFDPRAQCARNILPIVTSPHAFLELSEPAPPPLDGR